MSINFYRNQIEKFRNEMVKSGEVITLIDGSKLKFSGQGEKSQVAFMSKVMHGAEGYKSEPLPIDEPTPTGGNLHRLVWILGNKSQNKIEKEIEINGID